MAGLLAIDVGNTQTVLGLFEGEELREHWRVATESERTGDELGLLLRGLVDLSGLEGIAMSSTVPPLARAYEELAAARGPGAAGARSGSVDGIAVRYEDPREVGPDRIANAVAALERYGAPCIVVDFGTSTNFDVVSPEGEYVGGVLAPGVEVSMEGLSARAARLFSIDFAEPPTVIAKNTTAALQSGLVYGFAGQVDGIVEAIRGELGVEAQTVATGGLAELIVPHARTLETIDPFLTLEGVRLVWSATGRASRRRRSRSVGRGRRRPRRSAARLRAARALPPLPGAAANSLASTSSSVSSCTSSCLNGRGNRPPPRYQP